MPTTYAIPNGRTVMDATTYTGNATNRSISNADNGTVGFKPDFVWIKSRSNVLNSGLMDSVRGPTKLLISNATNAEQTLTDELTAFNTNGFSLGVSSNGYTNYNNYTYVAWQWQAGQGTTSTNNVGSISSTTSVNATAGFSIVTYTGNGVASTVGHGLGVAPSMIIVKNRTNSVRNWVVYHSGLTSASYYLILNNTNAQSLDTGVWNATAPTSSVFSINNAAENNESSGSMVAYCWAEIAGFSKFGSYTGNGSTDGPFIYTGFRPKYILIKLTSDAGYDWYIYDTSRMSYNVAQIPLFTNQGAAESANSAFNIDILSNGFKCRSTYAGNNGSGSTYIYMAFAENPFKYANAR